MPYSARPPGLISRLKRKTSYPARAICRAANIPAGPAPTTKTPFIRYPLHRRKPSGKLLLTPLSIIAGERSEPSCMELETERGVGELAGGARVNAIEHLRRRGWRWP